MRETVLVVPCYNEAGRIDTARFQQFVSDTKGVRVLFVNDGSTDKTERMLNELVTGEPDTFSVHSLSRHAGKAEAVRQGMLLAIRSSPVYVGYWDADLSTPLDAVPEFVKVLDADARIAVVTGARVCLLGRRIRRAALRHYLGRVFATLASATLRLSVYDTQCGAKLFRVSDSLALLLEEPFRTRWIFDVELLARLVDSLGPTAHERIYELPLQEWEDVGGSKLRVSDAFQACFDLVAIYWRLRTRRLSPGFDVDLDVPVEGSLPVRALGESGISRTHQE
jgi:glycosyltransferase involved in cell wall biosynthesis